MDLDITHSVGSKLQVPRTLLKDNYLMMDLYITHFVGSKLLSLRTLLKANYLLMDLDPSLGSKLLSPGSY